MYAAVNGCFSMDVSVLYGCVVCSVLIFSQEHCQCPITLIDSLPAPMPPELFIRMTGTCVHWRSSVIASDILNYFKPHSLANLALV